MSTTAIITFTTMTTINTVNAIVITIMIAIFSGDTEDPE